LDADIRTYLKSWQIPAGDDGWGPRINLRQLLSHTAGTTVHGFPGYPADGTWPSLAQILDGVPPANTSPIFVELVPGLQFRYSGGGTSIAQLAVTHVVGTAFPDLMRELVLAPLKMEDSSFEQPPSSRLADRAAVGHPQNGTPIPGGWHVYPEMAAAGLWSYARPCPFRSRAHALSSRRDHGLEPVPKKPSRHVAPTAAGPSGRRRICRAGLVLLGRR
jgi:CubicO group peptidase (beta-lactamase class C family)